MKRKIVAVAAALVVLGSAPIASADDYVPQWTVDPPAPGWNPGPYDDVNQAFQQAHDQENTTGQYTWVHDQNGNLP